MEVKDNEDILKTGWMESQFTIMVLLSKQQGQKKVMGLEISTVEADANLKKGLMPSSWREGRCSMDQIIFIQIKCSLKLPVGVVARPHSKQG